MHPTLLGTSYTGFGTGLAVLMVVLLALLRTPFADFGAQAAIFTCKGTAGQHKFDADQTGIDTLQTTIGAIVVTFFAQHFG